MKKYEIQVELKSLGEKILLLSKQVAEIKEEKEEKEDIGAKEIDFGEIERVGRKNPINGHCMRESSQYEKELYINMLFSVAMIEKEKLNERLTFIERIRQGMGSKKNLEESYKKALLVDNDTVDEFIKSVEKSKKGASFIIDYFMVYGDIDSCSDDVKEHIAEMCELFGIAKNVLKGIINVVKVMLSQSLDVFEWDDNANYQALGRDFRYYLPIEKLEECRSVIYTDGCDRGRCVLVEIKYIENNDYPHLRKGDQVIISVGKVDIFAWFNPNGNPYRDIKKTTITIDRDCVLQMKGIRHMTDRDCYEFGDIRIIHCLDYLEDDDDYCIIPEEELGYNVRKGILKG